MNFYKFMKLTVNLYPLHGCAQKFPQNVVSNAQVIALESVYTYPNVLKYWDT